MSQRPEGFKPTKIQLFPKEDQDKRELKGSSCLTASQLITFLVLCDVRADSRFLECLVTPLDKEAGVWLHPVIALTLCAADLPDNAYENSYLRGLGGEGDQDDDGDEDDDDDEGGEGDAEEGMDAGPDDGEAAANDTEPMDELPSRTS